MSTKWSGGLSHHRLVDGKNAIRRKVSLTKLVDELNTDGLIWSGYKQVFCGGGGAPKRDLNFEK